MHSTTTPTCTAIDHPTWGAVTRLALASTRAYGALVRSGMVHLRRDRLGEHYSIEGRGNYDVFRETVSSATTIDADTACVLVVGFRLRVIRSARLPHWLFQRACVLTTPFWSGFPGFGVKLWMVDRVTQDYLGIYQWHDEGTARTYVTALAKVLRPLSVTGTVWYDIPAEHLLDAYLDSRHVRPTSSRRGFAAE